ncbi:MAG: efflux RND transporter periplasmic adaptor subunit [Thermoguttaceae bacterium]
MSQRVRSLRLPQQTTAGGPSGRFAWSLVLLLAASTAVLGYMTYVQRTGAKPVKREAAKMSERAKAAKAPAAVAASSGGFALESKGYIIPAHQILVSPKVGGMVIRLKIIESQHVKKGDVLAEIEDIEYRADRDRAKANLESARQNLTELERGLRPEEIAQTKAELAEGQAQLVQLEADYKRAAELLAKRVLSKEQYDSALSKYHAMERRVQRLELAVKLAEEGPRIERINVARAQVGQAQAELAKAQWRLDNCIIRAPVSGTILKKNVEEGSLVNPIANQGYFSLCEMADLSDLEVELKIQEREIGKVFNGQKCKVRAEAYPERIYDGYVSRQMPTADRGQGAIPVRVKLKVPASEEGVYLKPDMGAIVTFLNK